MDEGLPVSIPPATNNVRLEFRQSAAKWGAKYKIVVNICTHKFWKQSRHLTPSNKSFAINAKEPCKLTRTYWLLE
jgi:hypothetical protein